GGMESEQHPRKLAPGRGAREISQLERAMAAKAQRDVVEAPFERADGGRIRLASNSRLPFLAAELEVELGARHSESGEHRFGSLGQAAGRLAPRARELLTRLERLARVVFQSAVERLDPAGERFPLLQPLLHAQAVLADRLFVAAVLAHQAIERAQPLLRRCGIELELFFFGWKEALQLARRFAQLEQPIANFVPGRRVAPSQFVQERFEAVGDRTFVVEQMRAEGARPRDRLGARLQLEIGRASCREGVWGAGGGCGR